MLGKRNMIVDTARSLRASARWCVSGTPIKNLFSIEESPPSPTKAISKKEAKADRDDMTAFAGIIGRFLRCAPFDEDPDYFSVHLGRPFMERRPFATQMQALLDRLMIRSRWRDTQEENELPPLTREVRLIDFDPISRLTYNAILALFVANSILTEREGEHYFFDPRNRKFASYPFLTSRSSF